jgi:hypothetical protein
MAEVIALRPAQRMPAVKTRPMFPTEQHPDAATGRVWNLPL